MNFNYIKWIYVKVEKEENTGSHHHKQQKSARSAFAGQVTGHLYSRKFIYRKCAVTEQDGKRYNEMI